MYILLSLVLISLIALTIMFSRKLVLLKNEGIQIEQVEGVILELPFVKEIKHLTIRQLKRYGYIGVVTSIRLYFRGVNLAKVEYNKIKEKLSSVDKSKWINDIEKREVNKFLKVVSNYKHKIRQIKHQIKEEENIL